MPDERVQKEHQGQGGTALQMAKAVWNPRMLMCCLLGFSSGLPLYIGASLLQTWLRREGMGLGELGLFNLTGLPYAFKFLWAPLLDRFSVPGLGRRRGWALVSQVTLMGIVGALGLFDPVQSVEIIAGLALALSFVSATQDIAVNAYQRELLPDSELGLGNSLHVNVYRLSQLVPAFGLILSDQLPWKFVFPIVALFMLIGVGTSLFGPQVAVANQPTSLKVAFIGPFREFFSRKGFWAALTVLAFLLLYKLGDAMATSLLSAFYVDLGFTNTEIGATAKTVGLISTVVGLLVGGLTIVRIGINRALWIFGGVQIASIFGFALLAEAGPDLFALGAVVAFEYLGVGLGTAAFAAFMARTTNRRFSGTQLARFSSLVTLPRTAAASSSGFIIEALGYRDFFFLCGALAVPGLLLLPFVAPWSSSNEEQKNERDESVAD